MPQISTKNLLTLVILWLTVLSGCYGYDLITNSSCVPPTPVNPENLSLRISQGKLATRLDVKLPSGYQQPNRCVLYSYREGPFNTTVFGTENNVLLLGNPQYSLSFQAFADTSKYTVRYTIGNSLFYASTVTVNNTGATADIYYNGKTETVPALTGEAPLVRI